MRIIKEIKEELDIYRLTFTFSSDASSRNSSNKISDTGIPSTFLRRASSICGSLARSTRSPSRLGSSRTSSYGAPAAAAFGLSRPTHSHVAPVKPKNNSEYCAQFDNKAGTCRSKPICFYNYPDKKCYINRKIVQPEGFDFNY